MPTNEDIASWRQRLSAAGEELPAEVIAIAYLITRELNTLRSLHGLPPYTKSQVITAIRNTAGDLSQD